MNFFNKTGPLSPINSRPERTKNSLIGWLVLSFSTLFLILHSYQNQIKFSNDTLRASFINAETGRIFTRQNTGSYVTGDNKYQKSNQSINDQDLLAEGAWYKVGITQDGIYKIDYDFLRNTLGINPENFNPGSLQIYGKPSGMLPQKNAALAQNPLRELAIEMNLGNDDQFNQGDYFLFYGQGPDASGWVKNPDTGEYNFHYQKHNYADTAYYLVTWGQEKGKRINKRNSKPGDFPIISTFHDFQIHENEKINILNSGRDWFGTKFSENNQQSFSFEIPGIKSGTNLSFISRVLSQSNNSGRFDISINGVSVGTQNLNAIPQGQYSRKGNTSTDTFQLITEEWPETISVDYNYDGDGGGPGYLDYFFFTFERNLALYEDETSFRSLKSLNEPDVTYEIEAQGEGLTIWDLSRPHRPVQQAFNWEDGKMQFGISADSLREFMVFNEEDLVTPLNAKKVKNQDLRNRRVPDMVIVSNPTWLSEAEKLADLRRQKNGLEVKVVTPEMIYNAFSSGTPDITAIRDYMKFLYDQDNKKLKYLLLFGKCSYDYKNIIVNNTNFVPTYQSRNSLHPIFSYSSDDYFGFLEDGEGVWKESSSGDHTLDIGVGRLPVKTKEEAQGVVDKLIHYETNEATLGNWRNEIYFLADDGDYNIHQRDANRLASLVDSTYEAFNVNKIFIDAFPQQPRAGGENAPEVNDAINEAIKQGALIFNYTGHGNEAVLAAERVIDKGMINGWDNLNKLPFFVTATCEFGRHDDPNRISGAESLVLKENGGAVGMVSTARPVFASTNERLNRAFYYKVFKKENGRYPSMGEVFKFTKNNSLSGSVNRNFSLLGDPSMQLAYPEDSIVIDSILAFGGKNYEKISGPTDTLKALGKVRLKGKVVQGNADNFVHNFNGILDFLVFDKPERTQTLGNDGPVFTFEQRENIIYKGKARIENGQFSIDLLIPKNIIYKKGRGKISMYARRNKGSHTMEDAAGANNSVFIGGSASDYPVDNQGPEITLYMDDYSFQPGGITGTNTTLLAVLQDEYGISRAEGGIGQNIVATVDSSRQFQLNDFYTADTGTYKRGFIEYPMHDLEEGRHTITLEARDSYNNPGKASIHFFVGDKNELNINRFKIAPNPFRNKTKFIIDHNKSGQELLVDLRIFNIQNQLVFRNNQMITNASSVINEVVWDGRNKTGERVKPGVYIAKLVIKSLTDGSKNSVHQRLILIN